MSDKMIPIPTGRLITWMIDEYINHNSIFGIPEIKFYRSFKESKHRIFGNKIDNLIGPAAGPHTQMAQNLISAYLTGGRFFELKTVQILDALEIKKPCIDATDECYNIEWSQELLLEQSYTEYVKAWILIHLLKNLFNLSNSSESGFVFNISVGYNLEGIKSEKIDGFINRMKDSSGESVFEETVTAIKNALSDLNLSKSVFKLNPSLGNTFNLLNSIPRKLTNSVTLSTMHGCPPEEIEAIAKYLLTEKKLNTYVKLNPTLLGYDFINDGLDKLGYTYLHVGEEVFAKDLKLDDAIPMIQRLEEIASQQNLEFGVKLSNTLPVSNERPRLEEDEMYLSGRALFPFTISLASRLVSMTSTSLNISYSGGANIHNTPQLINAGLKPITFATELLKPGGYYRLKTIAEASSEIEPSESIDLNTLKYLSDLSFTRDGYHKSSKFAESIKIDKELPLLDCFMAPCKEACPINQDVPEYIHLVNEGRYDEAVEIITSKNALPNITAHICDHQCMYHCTRIDYDSPVLIREIKKEACNKGFEQFESNYNFDVDFQESAKIAVIGAGPAGLSASYFLSRAGFDVTVFEKELNAGGIVKNVIPHFRLPAEAIEKDIAFIEKHGVRFVFGCDYNFSVPKLFNEGYKYLIIAIGSNISNNIKLNEGNADVLDALDFLWEFRHGKNIYLGEKVAVIGGGNSAMDGARAAIRTEGVKKVYLIYRRTLEYMPADMEEFNAAIEDGVSYIELLQPIKFEAGVLHCRKMKLGEFDSDGRRKAVPTDETITLEVNTVISAIGEHTDYDLFESNDISIEKNISFKNSKTLETSAKNVFVCGDASTGPSTVVNAIADAGKVCDEIFRREKGLGGKIEARLDLDPEFLVSKKAVINEVHSESLFKESERCLMCNYECNKCVGVCPNRANVQIKSSANLRDANQILHIDSLCNECGNCETFCPYNGKPYKQKLTLFRTITDFDSSENPGFIRLDSGSYRIRSRNEIFEYNNSSFQVQNNLTDLIKIIEKDYYYLFD